MKKTGFLALGLILAGLLLAAPPPIRRDALIPGAARPAAAPAKPAARTTTPAARSAAKPSARPAAAVPARKGPPPMTGKPAGKGKGPEVPYRSAIAVDESGRVLFADKENNSSYPASVTKLMTFLLVLEDIQAGAYKLTDRAAASVYASTMEPSSVGIKPGETMTIEDLLYAIMIKSANDAAVVLAEHAAWAKSGGKGPLPAEQKGKAMVEAFVARMNARARELGMNATTYASPNGLPPGLQEKRGFDTSTAADIAKLCRRIVQIPGALKYTSSASKTITDGSGQKAGLTTHNYFLPGSHDKDGCARPIEGCDGLKTGYTAVSGSSIALTAARNKRRVIVVVLGSAGRHEREAAAGRILRDALDAVSIW